MNMYIHEPQKVYVLEKVKKIFYFILRRNFQQVSTGGVLVDVVQTVLAYISYKNARKL